MMVIGVMRHTVPARDEVGPDTPLRLADAARIAEIPILRTTRFDEDARDYEITIKVPPKRAEAAA
jgi:hypothetical protein